MGIRLFNQHQNKGGMGLPKIDEVVGKLKLQELMENVQKEVDEVNEVTKAYVDLITGMRDPPTGKARKEWDHIPTDAEVEKAKSDLLYHRQYLCYLLNLQEDLSRSIEQLAKDQAAFNEELTDLDALVGGRVSVPKEQVYPRFDAVARGYRTAWTEVKALQARTNLQGVLRDLRKKYFPNLSAEAKEFVAKYRQINAQKEEIDSQEPADLDSIPGPAASGQDSFKPVRLTVENAPDFLQLSLDFQGFCIHTLVTQDRLLIPGNPALGVVKYAGRLCVFSSERAMAEFCNDPEAPDRFFGGVRDVCYKHPELIHLMRIHEDFPKSSLRSILQLTSGRGQAAMMADAATETPLHFAESNIDKSYEWNEWKMRKEALHMADIKRKQTSATQTALSHLRREAETQVYLAKEVATNTTKESGTNPPRWRKYNAGLRGEPQPMKVVEVKFDL